MRLSISTKIFLGFVVVLLAYGGASAYGAWAVRALGQQIHLVALGYSNLSLDLRDLQTMQAQLQKRLVDPQADPRYLAPDRNLRRTRLGGTLERVQGLRQGRPPQDARFLDEIRRGLQEVGRLYEANEPLYERRFGARRAGPGAEDAQTEPELRQREEEALLQLQRLSRELNNKVIDVVEESSRYETRAVLAVLLLAVAATIFGLLVMLLVQATLRPLKLLIDSARAVALGNYQERVPADSPDEVGALGREFNAMAAALQEREQRLRRSEQLAAVGKMAAQIAHEVRNPLSSIGLNAELLTDEVAADNSEAQALLKAIAKEVDRLARITEQYLRFARLPDPHFEARDVGDLLRSVLSFQQEELAARGVQVETTIGAELPRVPLDENQLRQALLNLLRNAAEALADLPPDQRRLWVQAQRAGAGVELTVRDSGPGIPEGLRERIFEPFFTTKKGGTGLGLALVQEVALRHGGTLAVACPAEGGTVFTLHLPTAPA